MTDAFTPNSIKSIQTRHQKVRKRNKLFHYFGIALLLVGITYLMFRDRSKDPTPTFPTIGSETTFVTDPKFILDNGFVSYAQAIDAYRKGDTQTEENACVHFMRACGPSDKFKEQRFKQVWQIVSDNAPFPEGPFIADPGIQFWSDTFSEPWKQADFPEQFKWIEDNQQAIDEFVRGAQKSKFFFPLNVDGSDETLLLDSLIPIPEQANKVSRVILARALNRLANGELEGCMNDLLAVRATGRLISQNGVLAEQMFGCSIQSDAIDVESRLIESRKLSLEQLKNYLEQIDQLSSRCDLFESFNYSERIIMLNATQYGIYHADLGSPKSRNGLPLARLGADLDFLLRRFNEEFDVQANALKSNTFAEKVERLNAAIERLVELDQIVEKSESFWGRTFGTKYSKDEVLSAILLSTLMPGAKQALIKATQCEAKRRLSRIGIHAEFFRIKNGRLPETLAELIDLEEADLADPFTGEPMIYQKINDGFRIHARGPNFRDDGGVQTTDVGPGSEEDDIRIEVGLFGSDSLRQQAKELNIKRKKAIDELLNR